MPHFTFHTYNNNVCRSESLFWFLVCDFWVSGFPEGKREWERERTESGKATRLGGGNGRARTKAKAKAKPSTGGRRARGGAGGSVSRLVGRPVVSFFPVGPVGVLHSINGTSSRHWRAVSCDIDIVLTLDIAKWDHFLGDTGTGELRECPT